MRPKISMIIPVYNSEKYLPKCFDSILANKYENLEIITVNDGSKDNSQKVIDAYKEKYPDIFKCIIEENQGIGMARNNGLDAATGDYIMFMDNDDFIDEDYINTHVKEIEQNDYDIVISGYQRVTYEKVLFRVSLNEKYKWSRYVSIAPWGKLYKRKFLVDNDIKFLKTPIGEDVYFNLQANTLSEKIKIINYTGYNWYYNNRSVTNTISRKIKNVDVVQLLNTHYGILKEKGSLKESNKDLIELYFSSYIIQFIKWAAQGFTFDEISEYYDKYFNWLSEHFPNYKKCKFWKLSKGDRFVVRLIISTMMIAHKLHLGKLLLYIYKLNIKLRSYYENKKDFIGNTNVL